MSTDQPLASEDDPHEPQREMEPVPKGDHSTC